MKYLTATTFLFIVVVTAQAQDTRQDDMKSKLTLDKVVDSKTWDQNAAISQELRIPVDPFVWDWKKRVRIGLYFPEVAVGEWRKITQGKRPEDKRNPIVFFDGAVILVTDGKGKVIREVGFGEAGNEPEFYSSVPFISFSIVEFPGAWWETYTVTLRIPRNPNELGLPEKPLFLIGISSLPWL